MDKPCEMCGEMMYGVTRQRRFCGKCTDVRNRQRMEKNAAKRGCLICGGPLGDDTPRARYCAKCRAERRAQAARRKWDKWKPKNLSLAEINAQAREKHLSYGKLVAAMAKEKKQN